MSFEYFYNREAEQYIHYTLPKILFSNEQLRSLSINAKFLYAILLDRAKLSYKNGFIDKDGKVYLYFAQAELEKLLNCGRTKVSEYFRELDEPKGVGLIERQQKVGIGKSDRIYIKNFAKPLDDSRLSSEDKAPLSRFAYFHDMENLRFENYQVPKTLFLDEQISKISNTAKMAYSIMLDRTKLSMSKGWQDKNGRIYIIFPQKELQAFLGCSLKTVNSALKELDIRTGVGLIERTKQGMNNPDITYILDYSTDLKYKSIQHSSEHDNRDVHEKNSESVNSEHQEVKSVNIGRVKSEHREVKNLNIGRVKSEHREVKNLNIGSVKSEHLIYNNTDNNNTEFNNTDFIDTHSINQSVAHANADFGKQIDGLTDKTKNSKKEMSFPEMLNAIDFPDYGHCFKNETEFYDYYGKNYYEMENYFKKCTIPYCIVQKPKKELEKALKFLFGYNCYDNSDKCEEKETQIFIGTIITSLLFLLQKESCVLNKEAVKRTQIIDIINELIHTSSLMAWLEDFKVYWGRARSEYKPNNPEAYFRTCVWNSMNDFQFRDQLKNNGDYWQAGYDIETYYRKNDTASYKSSNYEIEDKSNECSQSYPNDFIIRYFLTAALINNEPLSNYLKNYSSPLPNGLTLESPNDLTDEMLKKLEEEYNVSLISLREKRSLTETTEQSEHSPELQTETAADEKKSEFDSIVYSDEFIVTYLLSLAIQHNKPLKEYLGEKYQYPLPHGLTFNSPNDLTEEQLTELEEKYGVGLRK